MYSISLIAEIIHGKLIANTDTTITIGDLVYDSRNLQGKNNPLFFALVTSKNNGHKYIAEALAKGVNNFVVQKEFESQILNYSQSNFIIVDNTLLAMQQLATYHRQQFSIPIIGITGSNGKTAVKEWLCQLLCEDYTIAYSPNSFNSQIGVPLSVWTLKEGDQLGIFEAGISQPNEMMALQKIIQPTIGIFTNIGTAHDGAFDNMTQKINEKLQLFTAVGTLIYCADHDAIDNVLKNTQWTTSVRLLSWSRKKTNVDLFISDINVQAKETRMSALYKGNKIHISIPFTDAAAIENAIHCWLTMLLLGYKNDVINQRIAQLIPVSMRLEIKHGINNCLIINDTYNSDINSLQIAIDLMDNQKQYAKKTVIISDILQSRQAEKDLYADIADLLRKKKVDRIIGIGEAINRQQGMFDTEKEFFRNTDEFLAKFNVKTLNHEVVLIKGARDFCFERIANYLEEKTHETILEVNLKNMIANMNYYRSLLHKETKVMAMVKAFSYGTGGVDVANALQYHGVNYLTVAYADEGISLRNQNIQLPIMVMNPEQRSVDTIIKYNLQPEIYSFSILQLFLDGIKEHTNIIRVHIKIDTGMHRLGFLPEEIPALIGILKANKQIVVESVFSHFVAADDPTEDDFSTHQVELLSKVHQQMTEALGYRPLKHIANTAGLCRFPQYHFDMVRMGIGLYGINPFVDKNKISNVATLKTIVSQVKSIKAGETVGYNRRFKADRDSVIATIPIGYADGLPRSAGNGHARVLINGKLVPIVGNICMDMCMVDVTDVPTQEGDMVIVFGKELPLENLAQATGLITYELLTGISQRVKRIYVED